VSPGVVAQVVAVVFLSQGRDVPGGVADVWLHIFEDLADGPDVLEVTRRVVRSAQYVTAGEVHRAIVAERKRQASRRALPAPDDDGPVASPETVAFWRAECRRQLHAARGPLACSLAPLVTIPRADEPYFADHHGPEPVEQWYGDDPPPEEPPAKEEP
jgi:hypothetical protein